MPLRGLVGVLWSSVHKMRSVLREVECDFPRVSDALAQLEAAMQSEAPRRSDGKKRKRLPGVGETGKIRSLQQRARRLTKKCALLQGQVDAATGARLAKRQLRAVWLVRIALAQPLASSRSLVVSFRDCCDADEEMVSRYSICCVKDAFAQVVRAMKFRYIAASIHNSEVAALATRSPLQCFVLTHIQDEASLRFRSFEEERVAAPARARASKVQQHVVTFLADGGVGTVVDRGGGW